jgi:UDP-GlcNAc:undecaprenyl-phosphate GlcNAc-1-phosphate transferase
MNPMHWLVLCLTLLGLLIALPMTWLLVRAGHRVGAMDSAGAAGHHKAELRRVPNIGGIGIVLAVLLPMGLGLALLWIIAPPQWIDWLPALRGPDDDPLFFINRVRESTPTAVAMLGCMLLLHVMGLIDDRRSLPAVPKLIVQIGAASVMAVWFDVRLLTLLGPLLSVMVTVLWIVAITNAINFLDNMDGLAGGVSAIAASLFMVATLVNGQYFIAGTLALLIGGLCGFLVFNFPPAKIFMGDGGSLVVGFLLAVLTARVTYYHPAPDYALGSTWYGVFMPIIVLAIPLYDFVTVSVIRIAQGRSPLVGDQQHFSHRLVQRGLSKRGAVVVIWGLTAVTGIGGVSLGRLAPWQAVLVGLQTSFVWVVIGLLEHASRRRAGSEHAP